MRLINLNAGRFTPLLKILPFVILALIYWIAADARHALNSEDKLLPTFEAIGDAVKIMVMEPDELTEEPILYTDTIASLSRIAKGLGIATIIGLVFGIVQGTLPLFRALLSPFSAAVSLIPPIAILPILLIIFGLDESAKVALIVIGVAPFLIRDTQQYSMELSEELLIKVQTLGASTWQIIVRVVLPHVMPRLLDALRLSLGAAWLFLITAEAIASSEGLGYRIFLMRRYMEMDVILPYVAWITFLAFLMDWSLAVIIRKVFPWYRKEKK
ncbi:MAG: ABC transporter permease subunit [Sulfuricurvum sp.]|nr:ABC transporter permease subunit [Sulfuricurvum sp.]